MRRLLTICGATILVDTAFYAVIAPLLPRYADELGLSKAEAGILTAAYGVGTLLGALPAGALAARIGARATVVLGLGLLGGASVVFGLAGDVLVLDAARFVQGLGGACTWAGTLAWVAEAAPPGRRGEMIGIVLGAAIGGALLGPVLGAVAEASAPELVFGGVAAVAVGLAVAALATPASRPAPAQPLAEVARALGRRPVLAASWLVALPAAGFSMLGVLGPLRLDDLGAGGTAIGATFLVAAAVEAAVNPVVGRLSDRRGRLLPIRIGLAASAPLLLLFTAPEAAVALIVVIVAAIAALGCFWAPAMALLSDAAAARGVSQGLAFGVVNLAWALGQVAGSAGGGALAKATSDALATGVVAAAVVATLAATGLARGRATAVAGADR